MLVDTSDKAALAQFFARDQSLHLYETGDLDPFFWPDTRWFGWALDGELRSVALLYTGTSVPTLVVLERTHLEEAAALLRAVRPQLPARFYAHLSPGLAGELDDAELHPHGTHLKMSLQAPDRARAVRADGAEPLGPEHHDELLDFYQRSYPGNWFVPRMLETGQYFAIRRGGSLAAVAGVHVYSPRYRVAALGNITTLPEQRGNGLGRQVTARVCQSLLESVTTIGLNVHADNAAAIRCYRGIGFEVAGEYEEYRVESRLSR